GQPHASTHESRSPVTLSWPTSTARQNSDRSRSSSTAVSAISSRESAVVLDPRWGELQDSPEAAGDSMGAFDTLLRGRFPTASVAAGLGAAARGGGGGQSANTRGGALTSASGAAAAGGGGASAAAVIGAVVRGAASTASQPGPVSSSAPAPAQTVALRASTAAGAGAGIGAMEAQELAGNRPEASAHASPVAGDVGSVVPVASSSPAVKPETPPAMRQAFATA